MIYYVNYTSTHITKKLCLKKTDKAVVESQGKKQ
ncbi:hypothetical protein ACVWYG_002262 [Pedobacter sp. UYEF25]